MYSSFRMSFPPPERVQSISQMIHPLRHVQLLQHGGFRGFWGVSPKCISPVSLACIMMRPFLDYLSLHWDHYSQPQKKLLPISKTFISLNMVDSNFHSPVRFSISSSSPSSFPDDSLVKQVGDLYRKGTYHWPLNRRPRSVCQFRRM